MNSLKRAAATSVIAALSVSAACLAAPTNAVTVGPNVQVSAMNAQREHGEVLTAADPSNANHLIACSFIAPKPHAGLLPSHLVVYATFDGGSHWQPTVEHAPFAADPACALGKNGLALFAAGGGPVDSEGYFEYKHSYMYRSTDGGRTWSKPQLLAEGDREFFSVDNVSKRFPNRVYFHLNHAMTTLEGNKVDGLNVYHSTNGGLTYSAPVQASVSKGIVQVGPSTIMSDGTLIAAMTDAPSVPYGSLGSRKIQVVVSKDGGMTFSEPHLVSTWTSPLLSLNVLYALPSIAADTSGGPFNNRVYVSWPDTRYGHGNVLIAHSDDAGKTWSKPLVVDDSLTPGKGPNNYDAVVAVNRNGVVGVSWWDQTGITQGVGGNVRFAVSADGGESFGHSVPVSRAPSTMDPAAISQLDAIPWGGGRPHAGGGLITANIGPDKRYAVAGSDTTGLAADAAGRFHPVWVSDSTGIAQVWTAPISVSGRAIRNGDPSLANLRDVTEKVALRLTNATYDRTTHTIAMDAQLSNTSKQAISGPISFRILGLQSVIGAPLIQTSDNGNNWRGAIVTFQPNGSTATGPKQQTETRHLVFKITNPRTVEPDATMPIEGYISLEARAYAR